MGLFGLPRCPHCGGKTERTYASFPFPQLRCPTCIARNSEKEELEKRIAKLEAIVNNQNKNQ
jgi:tRNA(Ile2) C34 agmatinyltransferase TiaS